MHGEANVYIYLQNVNLFDGISDLIYLGIKHILQCYAKLVVEGSTVTRTGVHHLHDSNTCYALQVRVGVPSLAPLAHQSHKIMTSVA